VSDARPKLEVVPGGAGRSSQAGRRETAPAADAPRRRSFLLWALLALLLVSVALENRRAAGLAAQVGSLTNVVEELESELSAAEGAISAHRTHREEVRSFVAELSELVEREPEQAR
jgi:hypothetical protein